MPLLNPPPGAVIRFNLATGESDQVQILRILQSLSEQYARSPDVREFTLSRLGNMFNNDQDFQLRAVVCFVKQSVKYVRDPVGSEYVYSPVNLINDIQKRGFAFGDCDDHVLLLNSMLGSLGFPTKFVGVKLGRADRFNHVISGTYHMGRWVDIDPCSKTAAQPSYRARLVV